MNSILSQVVDIVSNELSVQPSKVTLDASFADDLGADSLDLVELVMTFEEKFGIEISDEDTEKLTTVGDVVDFLEKNLNI